ncbi:SHOCT domain-containing protein [Streptomyces avicenniae]|uniref:SHOCT domain-containing protein n=1 Tax=Streptomyces avicenniae TaxID=500153 RepID=UPI00069AB7D9|nr:SHOCT domain-containing protein [Streptomyces avicenniae]
MTVLAHTFTGEGPGPWVLLFPLVWATVVVGAVLLLRRVARRGGPGFRRLGGETPLDLLGRRYATGEIGAEEFRERRAVLAETPGR